MRSASEAEWGGVKTAANAGRYGGRVAAAPASKAVSFKCWAPLLTRQEGISKVTLSYTSPSAGLDVQFFPAGLPIIIQSALLPQGRQSENNLRADEEKKKNNVPFYL